MCIFLVCVCECDSLYLPQGWGGYFHTSSKTDAVNFITTRGPSKRGCLKEELQKLIPEILFLCSQQAGSSSLGNRQNLSLKRAEWNTLALAPICDLFVTFFLMQSILLQQNSWSPDFSYVWASLKYFRYVQSKSIQKRFSET